MGRAELEIEKVELGWADGKDRKEVSVFSFTLNLNSATSLEFCREICGAPKIMKFCV